MCVLIRHESCTKRPLQRQLDVQRSDLGTGRMIPQLMLEKVFQLLQLAQIVDRDPLWDGKLPSLAFPGQREVLVERSQD